MNVYPNIGIGDVLVKSKMFGITNHFGIVIGANEVLHNTPEKGEHLSTYDEFAAGNPVEVRKTGANSLNVMVSGSQILTRAKKYDLFNRNCEHTVTETLHGRSYSPQVFAFFCVALVVGAIATFAIFARRSR